MKNTIINLLIFSVFIVIWEIFFKPIIALILLISGFPPTQLELFLALLYLITLNEVVAKFLLLQALKPLNYTSTQVEAYPNLNIDELNQYTLALEQLGFIQLTDYTAPSLNGMARLLVNPQIQCFAEVGQAQGLPMFCSIVTVLEDDWILAITSLRSDRFFNGVSYAFMRQPKTLHKHIPGSSTENLVQFLLDWRGKVGADLGVNPVPLITAEDYFAIENRKRQAQRKTLSRKSITWSIIEMIGFWINPKDEWLGDYAKLKSD